MRQDVQAVLTRFHQDLVNGSYQDAWYLLSARKQEQTLSKTGFAPWATAQASLGRYLDPTGLQVAIQSVDPNTGEAVVLVTGMRWSKPNAKCTQWSGLTWMKYESGAWRYDPGYSTTPEREAQWLPRYSELLGAGC
jgi:hypothetical protein